MVNTRNAQDYTKGQASWAAAEVPTYKGCKDIRGRIGNMVLVNSGFHKCKNFS
jgi:hypothetical protein